MSKNYHIQGQFRPLESRENFSLKTHDIAGKHTIQIPLNLLTHCRSSA